MSSNEWSAPKGYKIANAAEMDQLVGDNTIRQVIDPIEGIANDLFELRHPDRLDDEERRNNFTSEIIQEGASYGRWFHYPWDDMLVRFAESDDHYDLRTARNRNLITRDEQQVLRHKKIAAFGLSVGSKIVDETVQNGIGNRYLLFDFDRLSPSNLNRIRATMAQVGLLKTTIAGRKMSALDPYIDQAHFIEGYAGDMTDALLRVERPDIIIEEVDDLAAKARLRRIAKELEIPLVMAGDVDDKSTIDVERYDQEGQRLFNGKLSSKAVSQLATGGMSKKDQESALIKLLGLRNISPRLLDSGMARANGELVGFPQLGTTATAGGSLATVAIRDIFLNRGVESITGVYDPRDIIKQGRPTTRLQDAATLLRFLKYRLNQKEGEA